MGIVEFCVEMDMYCMQGEKAVKDGRETKRECAVRGCHSKRWENCSGVGVKGKQKFFRMLPGDVLLASLDAFNKVLEAAEIVGKDALFAASEATVEIVANRFGEEAGEVTHDTFVVAGHAIGTAWNVTKVRKAINPASNGMISASALKALKLKNAIKAVTSASKCK